MLSIDDFDATIAHYLDQRMFSKLLRFEEQRAQLS
jgi:hypothetical protein